MDEKWFYGKPINIILKYIVKEIEKYIKYKRGVTLWILLGMEKKMQ